MSDGPAREDVMIAAAARELAGRRVCFVGIGLPNIAANVARRTVAPELELVYEAGAYGARPRRLPLSIGDPALASGALAVMPMLDVFGYLLQGGHVDTGFLGAAAIDRRGDIDTTVIGDYAAPTVRLPGSGGACEIALGAGEVIVVMRHGRRSFVERLDFVTSPGGAAATSRHRSGRVHGPTVVVTDLGVLRFDADGEMRLDATHPGVSVDDVRAATGWDLRVAADVTTTPPPTPAELDAMAALRGGGVG